MLSIYENIVSELLIVTAPISKSPYGRIKETWCATPTKGFFKELQNKSWKLLRCARERNPYDIFIRKGEKLTFSHGCSHRPLSEQQPSSVRLDGIHP